jgi:hypothetical protein
MERGAQHGHVYQKQRPKHSRHLTNQTRCNAPNPQSWEPRAKFVVPDNSKHAMYRGLFDKLMRKEPALKRYMPKVLWEIVATYCGPNLIDTNLGLVLSRVDQCEERAEYVYLIVSWDSIVWIPSSISTPGINDNTDIPKTWFYRYDLKTDQYISPLQLAGGGGFICPKPGPPVLYYPPETSLPWTIGQLPERSNIIYLVQNQTEWIHSYETDSVNSINSTSHENDDCKLQGVLPSAQSSVNAITRFPSPWMQITATKAEYLKLQVVTICANFDFIVICYNGVFIQEQRIIVYNVAGSNPVMEFVPLTYVTCMQISSDNYLYTCNNDIVYHLMCYQIPLYRSKTTSAPHVACTRLDVSILNPLESSSPALASFPNTTNPVKWRAMDIHRSVLLIHTYHENQNWSLIRLGTLGSEP